MKKWGCLLCLIVYGCLPEGDENLFLPLNDFPAPLEKYMEGKKIYFGSLHGHTFYSDGTQSPLGVLQWAKDTVHFDFYAITDHGEQLTEAEWNDLKRKTDSLTINGKFVALRGFEWSSNVYGHCCVFNTELYTGANSIPEFSGLIQWLTANERFNDITTDPRGRLYAGTKCNNNKNGKLFLIEKGMPPRILLEGLGISNGMTFSIDLKYFYHTDSSALTITRYHYDIHTGNISQPEIFYRGEEKNGYPDGITIDTEDHLWVAFWGASSVRRFNPHGKLVHELKIPARQPSSVMFGGEKLNELFITSACEGGDDIEKGLDAEGNFLGGITYKVITPYQGRPEWPADL